MRQRTRDKYTPTIYACFTGFAVQAIALNFAPLLFVTFNRTYNIPLSKITLLVTMSFLLQLTIDGVSAFIADRIGYRRLLVVAHASTALGLALLAVLPDVLPDPYVGLVISAALYSLGSGLLEVLVSPVMEACPTKNKERAMSMLHSFYCWGLTATVLLSTLFFAIFGIENWRILSCLWAIVPAVNTVAFARVPLAPLLPDNDRGMRAPELVKSRLFWALVLAMVCSGACEQAVSQWASTFAEEGLGVSKTMGDLLGPMMFAVTMGIARTLYGKLGDRIPLEKFMVGSSLLCMVSYLLISLVPSPAVGLAGCALCGFSVGIFWPGTISTASKIMRRGGTAMFCLLALGGDLGCTLGPTVVGLISSAAGDNMKIGFLWGLAFPLLMLFAIYLRRRLLKKQG